MILLWHRFTTDPGSADAYPISVLRTHLAFLRRQRFEIVTLEEMFHRLTSNDPRLDRSVSLTVDDGYADFAALAAPVFREFECPVTVFVTTGFLDGAIWMWWDRVAWMLENAGTRERVVDLAGQSIELAMRSPEQRWHAVNRVWSILKLVSDTTRLAALEDLAVQLDCRPPSTAPPEYRAMSWNDARSLARSQVEFGPHTVTHPILARCDATKARFEIEESWRRLRDELPSGIPLFAYPNGLEGDFLQRDVDTLRLIGIRGAVSTAQQYATSASDPMAVPRIAGSTMQHEYRNIASGLRRVAMAILRK